MYYLELFSPVKKRNPDLQREPEKSLIISVFWGVEEKEHSRGTRREIVQRELRAASENSSHPPPYKQERIILSTNYSELTDANNSNPTSD